MDENFMRDFFGMPKAKGSGLSLRDYFAAQAMNGFLLGARSDGWAVPNDHQNKMLAANAYATADAMLAARK